MVDAGNNDMSELCRNRRQDYADLALPSTEGPDQVFVTVFTSDKEIGVRIANRSTVAQLCNHVRTIYQE